MKRFLSFLAVAIVCGSAFAQKVQPVSLDVLTKQPFDLEGAAFLCPPVRQFKQTAPDEVELDFGFSNGRNVRATLPRKAAQQVSDAGKCFATIDRITDNYVFLRILGTSYVVGTDGKPKFK